MFPAISIARPLTTTGRWLIPFTEPIPEAGRTWYASLGKGVSRAEDEAYEALKWLLSVLCCEFQRCQLRPDTAAVESLLVPGDDELAIALADTAAALFFLTGAFTQDQAEAFCGAPRSLLLMPIPVPEDVITPLQEVTSPFGLVGGAYYTWVWEQPPGSFPETQELPRQGMLRAGTKTEAVARLRQQLPDVGPIRWISRREYFFPLGLEAAY